MNINYDLLLRILIGGLLGGAIGLERELRAKEAGFRTHFLVALGSALLTVVSAYGYDSILPLFSSSILSFDPSRIAAQIVSGIGFIGAGLIIFQKNVIHGLTTAAGLWVTSAIGIAAGVGHYDYAVASTVMVLIALEAMLALDHSMGRRVLTIALSSHNQGKIRALMERIKSDGMTIHGFDLSIKRTGDEVVYTATFDLHVKRKDYQNRLLEYMEGINGSITGNIK